MVNEYVLIAEFKFIPAHAEIFKQMVESIIDNLIATDGLKGKGPITLENAPLKCSKLCDWCGENTNKKGKLLVKHYHEECIEGIMNGDGMC